MRETANKTVTTPRRHEAAAPSRKRKGGYNTARSASHSQYNDCDVFLLGPYSHAFC